MVRGAVKWYISPNDLTQWKSQPSIQIGISKHEYIPKQNRELEPHKNRMEEEILGLNGCFIFIHFQFSGLSFFRAHRKKLGRTWFVSPFARHSILLSSKTSVGYEVGETSTMQHGWIFIAGVICNDLSVLIHKVPVSYFERPSCFDWQNSFEGFIVRFMNKNWNLSRVWRESVTTRKWWASYPTKIWAT